MKYDVITLGSATQDIFMASSDLQVVEGDQFITKKDFACHWAQR